MTLQQARCSFAIKNSQDKHACTLYGGRLLHYLHMLQRVVPARLIMPGQTQVVQYASLKICLQLTCVLLLTLTSPPNAVPTPDSDALGSADLPFAMGPVVTGASVCVPHAECLPDRFDARDFALDAKPV